MTGVPLYNKNDGITGRDGGPYLDNLEAEAAEKRRALVEGREPDLDNPPATAGIVLVTGSELASTVGVNSIPSQESRARINFGDVFKRIADDDETLLTVKGEIPEEFYTTTEPVEDYLIEPPTVYAPSIADGVKVEEKPAPKAGGNSAGGKTDSK